MATSFWKVVEVVVIAVVAVVEYFSDEEEDGTQASNDSPDATSS